MGLFRVGWAVFRALGATLLAGLLVASLLVNGSLMVGGAVGSVAVAAFEALSGLRSPITQTAEEVAELTAEVAGLTAEVAGLTAEVEKERRAAQQAKLARDAERRSNRQLKVELEEARMRTVKFRGREVPLKSAVIETTKSVTGRARNSALREVGAMMGESLPVVGIAVIAAVTAAELHDLCDTIRDMKALQAAIDGETSLDPDAMTVCSMEVKSKEQITADLEAAPNIAWAEAQTWVPALKEMYPGIEWQSYRGALALWLP